MLVEKAIALLALPLAAALAQSAADSIPLPLPVVADSAVAAVEPATDSAGQDTLGQFQTDSALLAALGSNLEEIPDAPRTVDLDSKIGVYYLYWETLYRMDVVNDFSSVIEPPEGYTILSAIVGNSSLFKVQQTKNRITLKKLAFDNVSTNLVVVLSVPTGGTKSFAIELNGKASGKPVSIAKFNMPLNRNLNRTVEALRSRYLAEMNSKLAIQEQTLRREVREKAMHEARAFRFNSWNYVTTETYKGADFALDAVVNQGPDAYVYMSTGSDDPHCQVVNLNFLETGDRTLKKSVDLVDTRQEGRRTYFVFKTSKLPDDCDLDWVFNVTIWSRTFEIATHLSLGGYDAK